jgi:hypothetical protein
MVYKDQQKTFPPLRPKIYVPPPHLKQTLHTQSGVTYSQITKHNSSAPSHIDDELHINTSLPHHYPQQPSPQQSNGIHELKTMMKGLFDQLESMLNLLTTVLAKLT